MSTTSHISGALSAIGLTPAAKLVLLIIAIQADQDGCRPAPFEDLADVANIAHRALPAVLDELVRARLIFHHVGIMGALGGEEFIELVGANPYGD